MIYWQLCSGDKGGAAGPAQADFLSAREFETYAGLRFPRRRSEWLLGRWTAKQLLRGCLDAYRDLPLTAISVDNDPDGAPYLSVEGKGRLPASLSISHRAGQAVCALSPALSPAIGIDLERVETRSWGFVEDYFTAAEAARVRACPAALRDLLVTLLWSAREAVFKGQRTGLRVDTRTVEIGPVPGIEVAPQPAPSTQPTLCRVGNACRADEWQPLAVTCRLPGLLRTAAWWRPEGESVLTLAAVWP